MEFILVANDKKEIKTYDKKEQLKKLGFKWTSDYSAFGKEWVLVGSKEEILKTAKAVIKLELNVTLEALGKESRVIHTNRECKDAKDREEFKETFRVIYEME